MTSVIPGAYYWATSDKFADGETTVVQVSTVFGTEPDYWTLAVLGSDQHFMITDFEIIARVEPVGGYSLQLAAE